MGPNLVMLDQARSWTRGGVHLEPLRGPLGTRSGATLDLFGAHLELLLGQFGTSMQKDFMDVVMLPLSETQVLGE